MPMGCRGSAGAHRTRTMTTRQQEAGGTAKTRGEGDVAARHTQKRQLEEQAAASSPTPRASWQDLTIATFVPLNLIGINRLEQRY